MGATICAPMTRAYSSRDPTGPVPGARLRIGIWDSGVGGLSVLRHCQARLPEADFDYIADSGFAPYGHRPAAWLTERSLKLARYLREQRGAEILVLACNTATAVAAEHVRAQVSAPLVAMEPGIKPAVAMTQSGVIAVLATPATLASERLNALVARYANPSIQVLTSPCEGLVAAIEAGEFAGSTIDAIIEASILPLVAAGADTLILGCTHYAWVVPALRHALGPLPVLLDTGPAIAEQLLRCLGPQASRPMSGGDLRVWTSGDPATLQGLAQQLLGYPVEVAALPEEFRA